VNVKNKERAVSEELERAAAAMQAADLMFDHDLISDAVSKLYYYLLYHLRVLLITRDLEPRSNEGVLRLFGLHFIKEGIFPAGHSHIVSRMMKYREEADYNPSYTFTEKDYTDFRGEVISVSEDVKSYLIKNHFLSE